MAEDDDLLQKADALMRRHRSYVAGAADKADEPGSADGDVPVLTEIVEGAALRTSAPPADSGIDIAEVRTALACELEAWLDEELPQHVMRVLDGITDQLIIQLSLKARSDLLPRLQAAAEAAAQAAKPAPPES